MGFYLPNSITIGDIVIIAKIISLFHIAFDLNPKSIPENNKR